jgi:hypothetical protein
MKTIKILFTGIAIIGLSSCATEFDIPGDDVPATVKDALKAKYPTAQVTKWEAEKMDGHLSYEAEFKVDGKEKEAYFKPDGTFIKEE